MYTDTLGCRWYKGNLHCHTIRSDGKVLPEECMARYQYGGYDFLAITDHWAPYIPGEECYKGMLLLSGCEYDVSPVRPYYGLERTAVFHINGIGFSSTPRLEQNPPPEPQAIIDAIRAAGGLATFNHPAWSHNIPDDIRNLKNLAGLEIYNTLCGVGPCHFADSSWYVDQLALGGVLVPAMASDDAHNYTGDECRSFIMVQADALQKTSILAAINAGCFYASQGPWVHVEQEGRRLRIVCSPAAEIDVFAGVCCDGRFCGGELLTGAEYTLGPEVSWYRVEVTDEKGRKAWTSPKEVKR
ncbi:MAG: CehA/McbA family metallohydrolase [Treponema sp.]|jgi:hypothetical protein|nr:CehA/McbA family metallohydrolase [Treponema sp.]